MLHASPLEVTLADTLQPAGIRCSIRAAVQRCEAIDERIAALLLNESCTGQLTIALAPMAGDRTCDTRLRNRAVPVRLVSADP